MKKCIFSILAIGICFSNLFGQNNQNEAFVVVGHPEYSNIVFRNYDNKIFIASSKGYITDVQTKNATIRPQMINGKKGYILRPSAITDCFIVAKISDEKGINIGIDTINFIVRPFPKPMITNISCSKSSGGRINVALPTDCPLGGVNYDVLSIEVLGLDNGYCEGNYIPAEKLTNIEQGKMIGIVVSAKNSVTGENIIINGSLKVEN
jgi:hypothetical protein